MDTTWIRNLPNLIKDHRRITFQDFVKAQETFSELNDLLHKVLPLKPDVVDKMTYEEVMSYFADERPADPRVVKGALFLLPRREEHLLVQVFLDRSNELIVARSGKPFGRQLVVRNLDAELAETFGDKRLVIVE